MKLKTTLAALIAVVAVPALAQTATPGIDARKAEQERRIQQGVKSGELTGKEASRLERGQEHVQRMEDRAKADGSVSAKERRRIEHAQDQESRKIYREKHDKQRDLDHDGKMDRPHRGPKH